MGLVFQIKKIFHSRELKSQLKTFSRTQKVVNLRDANFIGILFNANDRGSNKLINDYAAKLKFESKKVNLLGYYEGSKEPTDLYFPYFYTKDINWKLQPSGETVNTFLKKEYDILINLNMEENTYLTYIAAFSKAHFKVAMYAEHHSEYHDMMMKTKKDISIEALIDQLHHYLNVINKNAN